MGSGLVSCSHELRPDPNYSNAVFINPYVSLKAKVSPSPDSGRRADEGGQRFEVNPLRGDKAVGSIRNRDQVSLLILTMRPSHSVHHGF